MDRWTADCTNGNSVTRNFKIVRAQESARKIGEYSNVPDKTRLDKFAIELQNDPSAQGYIIAYGGRHGPAGEAQTRADDAKKYLVKSRGIDPARLVTVDGGYREQADTELWIVPSGAPPPTPSPTVDASEVQITRPPKRAPRRRGH